MFLHRIRIGFAYLQVFLKRQHNFFAHPLQSTFFKIAVFSITILLLGLFLARQYQGQLFQKDIRQGIIGIYQENEYPPSITNLLSRGLFKIDESGQVVPDLAKSIENNKEGTEFTVKLRDNLYWVDNTQVKAAEIQFNFPGAQVLYPDEKTIQFKLNEPFTPFPSLLTRPIYKGTFSASKQNLPSGNNEGGSLIGVGPYIIYPAKDVPKGQFVVKKVTLGSSDTNLPDLTIFMYPSENIAKQALRMGEIQSILGVNDIQEYRQGNDQLASESNYEIFSRLNQTQLVAIFYNTKDAILSDENFRLALSFGAPSIGGENEAKTSLPTSSWAFNSEVKDYLDNPEQAKNYLNKVEKGADQTITLTTTNYLKSVGEEVVAAWNSNGVKAQVKVESGIPQNFQALLIAQNIPLDPDQYALWHSTQSQTNISKISNPRIDKDLEDGRKATDSAKRKAAYFDFQKVLLDHSPATFLYFPKINVVYNKKIEDELIKVLKIQLGE